MDFLVLSALIGGPIGYMCSRVRGFSPLAGVVGGALLGPLAIFMLFVDSVAGNKSKACPKCAEQVAVQAVICKHCRSSLA